MSNFFKHENQNYFNWMFCSISFRITFSFKSNCAFLDNVKIAVEQTSFGFMAQYKNF